MATTSSSLNIQPVILTQVLLDNQNSGVEQFVNTSLSILERGTLPNQVLDGECSLLQRIFQYLGERRFDLHLDLLLPLIEASIQRGADFKQKVDEINRGIPCIDFSCQQIAFIYWRELKKEGHASTQAAWRLFELIGHNMDDIDECLFVGYLEKVTFLLRSNRPNPNQLIWGRSIMKTIFEELAQGYYEDRLEAIPDLIRALLECRGNPNLQFDLIKIKNKGEYQNPTCLHIAYLYWQSLKTKGKLREAKWIKQAFLLLLKDPRIDVRTRFMEISLNDRDLGHFSNYLWDSSSYFEPGDYLEDGNLAHYALIDGDFKTAKKVLDLAHDLLGATCFTTKGKWMLGELLSKKADFVYFEQGEDFRESGSYETDRPNQALIKRLKDSRVTGALASIVWTREDDKIVEPFKVIRYGGVSLCHIAARRLDLIACTFLASVGGNEAPPDSERRSVMEYAKLYKEDLLYSGGTSQFQPLKNGKEIEKAAKDIFKVLRKVRPIPRNLPTSFYTLHQDGYDVLYHPSSKCPIVREVLYEELLIHRVGNDKHRGYRQHPAIPKPNRATLQDFRTEGVICGHAKPRADALSSCQALYDVGYLTNILAQDSVLNNGLWKKLENGIRDLTRSYLCLHVYTGGVFTTLTDMKGPKTVFYRVIGQHEVSMPTHLFKVIYTFNYDEGWHSRAFLIPNVPLPYHTDLEPYLSSVQRIQELTGVDFAGFYGGQ